VASTPVTDYRVLAALAHPLRRRLLDVLRVHGPCTVTLLAGHTGSAVGNVSHHVRVLAGLGLVVEAPELARDARERWWRAGAGALRWDVRDVADDPAAATAAQAVMQLGLERQVGLVRQSLAAAPSGGDGFNTDAWMTLSADELTGLGEQVTALVSRWRERTVPVDGVERTPVFVLARGFPATP
jgi:DNA-binding transcriptional ArsR family regulator